MKIARYTFILFLLLAGTAFSQELTFPRLDHLRAKAAEVTDVTMDRNMLDFASKYLSDKNANDAEAKRLIHNLKGIYVRSFEFDKPGQYSASDIEPFRAQLKPPLWSKMVETHSKRDGEDVEVFFRLDNGAVNGLAVIAAEEKELTLIHIDGPIDPSQLGSLGGQFGIPKISVEEKEQQKAPAKAGNK